MDIHTPWDICQQPVHPAPGVDARYLALLSALDLGWKVSEPVYLRPRWDEHGNWVYHLILQHSNHRHPQLLSVPASLEMDSLTKCEGWQIDRYPKPNQEWISQAALARIPNGIRIP